MASAWSTETVTAVNYLSAAEDLTRFNNKSLGTNERNQTYKRWWKEQVRLYGTSVNYYVRKFDSYYVSRFNGRCNNILSIWFSI